MPRTSQIGRPSRLKAAQAIAACRARSASSSRTWSSHRPNAELVPCNRARRPSAVSSTSASARDRATADRPIQPVGPTAIERRRREHQDAGGKCQGIGPDRGRAEPLREPPRQGKCPVFAQRLIRQAPRQLLIGGRQRLRPVEPPDHGRFRRSPAPQAAPQAGRVVEAIGPQDRRHPPAAAR